MLSRIFPKQFENLYRGQWATLALLALLAIITDFKTDRSIAFKKARGACEAPRNRKDQSVV